MKTPIIANPENEERVVELLSKEMQILAQIIDGIQQKRIAKNTLTDNPLSEAQKNEYISPQVQHPLDPEGGFIGAAQAKALLHSETVRVAKLPGRWDAK